MSTLPQQHSALISHSQSKGPRGSLDFPIRNLRRYLTMISKQIATGASLIVKHPFIKPPVPTWPLHLTLFVAALQGTYDLQEHIVEDLSDIRFVIDTFFYYLPQLPMMQIVPFKLAIPEGGRGFPGVLTESERKETGTRTLPGQWIADRSVWKKVMALPLAKTAREANDPYAAREGEKVIMYTHGGGYFICSTSTHRELLWRISRATGRRIFAVDYRLAPEHPYPSALQDVSHAFTFLTDPLGSGFEPKNVTMGGDSAGGGLTIALMMYHRDEGLSTPSKALLLSPWLDLTMSCESWETNTMDYLPRPPRTEHKFNPIRFYCTSSSGPEANVNFKILARNPYISPLWGSLEGLPPMLIQCGEAERLRDECVLFTYKAGGRRMCPSQKLSMVFTLSQSSQTPQPSPLQRCIDSQSPVHTELTATTTSTSAPKKKRSSPPVELDMYPGMVHVFQAIPFLPDASLALQRMREFLDRKESEMDDENETTEVREP